MGTRMRTSERGACRPFATRLVYHHTSRSLTRVCPLETEEKSIENPIVAFYRYVRFSIALFPPKGMLDSRPKPASTIPPFTSKGSRRRRKPTSQSGLFIAKMGASIGLDDGGSCGVRRTGAEVREEEDHLAGLLVGLREAAERDLRSGRTKNNTVSLPLQMSSSSERANAPPCTGSSASWHPCAWSGPSR